MKGCSRDGIEADSWNFEFLCWMLYFTGSQCRVSWTVWMWSDFLALHTSLAAAFWTFLNLSSKRWGQPERKELSSLTETGQESIQPGFGLHEWWERCRREFMCMICMYAALHVLLMCRDILRFEFHGFTEIFNRWHKWDIGVFDVNDRRQRTVDRHSIWKYDHGFIIGVSLCLPSLKRGTLILHVCVSVSSCFHS